MIPERKRGIIDPGPAASAIRLIHLMGNCGVSGKATGTLRRVVMIGVKEAAARAVAFFGDIYGSQLANVMLEEVERGRQILVCHVRIRFASL